MGRDYVRAFEGMYPDLATKHGLRRSESAMASGRVCSRDSAIR